MVDSVRVMHNPPVIVRNDLSLGRIAKGVGIMSSVWMKQTCFSGL